MTVKSILDIDVNDSKFNRFKEQFERYQAALAKSSTSWKGVDKTTAEVGKTFEKMAAALFAHRRVGDEMGDSNKKQGKALENTDRLWTSIAKKTKSIAGDILSATRSLLSWTGILTGVGGLLGIGSLFGLERLGASASNQRRSSMGLGMSIGQQKAFQTNFSRLVDPDAFLGWVNQIETDPTKAWSAYALGAAPTGNTEEDAIRLLKAVRARAKSTPTSQLGLLQSQFGINMSVEDLRRLKTTSEGEFSGLLSGNQRDVGRLGISDDVAKRWQDFTTQMERAGAQISKVFINGLVPLTGPLEHLSGSLVHFVEILMRKDGIVEQGVNKLAGWLDSFAGKLDTQQWESSFERFTASIGDLADLIHTVAHPYDTAVNWASNKMSGLSQWAAPDPGIVTASKENFRDYLGRLDSKYGFKKGLLEGVWKTESGEQLYPTKSKKGAIGAFQFMPDTATELGVNPYNPLASANAAAEYLYRLQKKYGGDADKALAAYNWGSGNMDANLAAHPKDWRNFLPTETRNYLSVNSGINQSPKVNLVIQDQTGGSVNVATAQQAY